MKSVQGRALTDDEYHSVMVKLIKRCLKLRAKAKSKK